MCFKWALLSPTRKIFLVAGVVVSSILLITIIALAVLVGGPNYYCSSTLCPPDQTHTMCLYPSSYPATQCGEYISYPLTSDDEHALVEKHNQNRTLVANGCEDQGNPGPQPPAKNMQPLKWDSELAKIAQRWADQCTDRGHDKCREVERFSVGQNIATSSGGMEVSAVNQLKGWYGEVIHFSRDSVEKYDPGYQTSENQTGHYTQVVWAETAYVGCGRSRWRTGGLISIKLVCNYGPAGNYINDPVYLTYPESEANDIRQKNCVH